MGVAAVLNDLPKTETQEILQEFIKDESRGNRQSCCADDDDDDDEGGLCYCST